MNSKNEIESKVESGKWSQENSYQKDFDLESKEIQSILRKSAFNAHWKDWCWSSEAPILWPPDANSWLFEKDPEDGQDWRQKEKRVTEDEMAGWHHQFNGHELGKTPGNGEGQGSLVCCTPWGLKSCTQLCDWTTTNIKTRFVNHNI